MKNQIKMNALTEQEKIYSTNDYKNNYLDKIRKISQELQNLLRATNAKISKYQAETGERIPIETLNLYMIEPNLKEEEFYSAVKGCIELFKNNKYLLGIKGTGKQLNMIKELFLEVGTEPAATHKGGTASSK